MSDKKGESVMKSWQFRKFCADFGLAEGIKALAEMEVLYNSSTRDKSGHTHQSKYYLSFSESWNFLESADLNSEEEFQLDVQRRSV